MAAVLGTADPARSRCSNPGMVLTQPDLVETQIIDQVAYLDVLLSAA